MTVDRPADPDADQVLCRDDVCALASVRRVAAMLDLDPDTIEDGAPLPRGWHFFLMGGDTRRAHLRADGFPGFGLPMPDLGLPRLLLAGRTISYEADLPIGAAVRRRSRMARLERRETRSGPSAVVTLHHELTPAARTQAAIVETQTYILLPEAKAPAPAEGAGGLPPAAARQRVTPDQTLLFQYSALGFNSHKIHLDRAYAREVEGFPDLVVNGGLATLLATEFLRGEHGIVPVRLKSRHTAPLFCGRPITFVTRRDGRKVELQALDDSGVFAMTLELDVA